MPAVTSAPLATPISASPATNPAANRMPEPPSSRGRPMLASDSKQNRDAQSKWKIQPDRDRHDWRAP